MNYKAFKFRLTPNKEQQILISKTLGCTRFLYNQMLNERQTKYKNKEKYKNKTESLYKAEFPFLKEVDSVALQQSRVDLETSYKNFFRNLKKKQKTSLKFKSKRNPKNSYRTLNINNSIRIEENRVKLPKLGFVKFKKSRDIIGKIKSVTISKNILNKYYISVLCETEINKLSTLDKNIGIDLGIKDYLTTSDNTTEPNHKYLRKSELKLKKAQKTLSKRVKNSKNRFKQQKKVFRIHERIRNQRVDALHKLSTKLINENQVICLENLSVSNMVKNHKLAKSISDCGWSKFVDLLKYKSEWYGRELVQIDKFFPSSKLCNVCGYKNKNLQLKDREWTCLNCKILLDRDFNAALNILKEGLRIFSEELRTQKNRRDDEVSLLNIQTLVCNS
jgi:putative transposase